MHMARQQAAAELEQRRTAQRAATGRQDQRQETPAATGQQQQPQVQQQQPQKQQQQQQQAQVSRVHSLGYSLSFAFNTMHRCLASQLMPMRRPTIPAFKWAACGVVRACASYLLLTLRSPAAADADDPATIEDESGATDLGDAGKVWLCSDLFDCLFYRTEIFINQVSINPPNNYAYLQ